MSPVIIIIKKELKDLIRDKRTMLTMVIIPLLLFPVIMSFSGNIASKQIKKETEKNLKLLIEGADDADSLSKHISDQNNIIIVNLKADEFADTLLKNGSLDAILIVHPKFDSIIQSGGTAVLTIKHKSVDYDMVRHKLNWIIDRYKDEVLKNRLAALHINESVIRPVETKHIDISTKREKFGKSMGGMIPYIFIIFSYIGCMYPAIDLFTNEKERGTLETILATPVNRLQILFGKMSVVAITGLTSAILSIVGLFIGMKQFSHSMPRELMGSVSNYADPKVILLLLSMLVPLVLFIAGLMTIITNYARTYKEAQSLISPLMMVIIIPAVMGMMPFIELNMVTAFVPITNISLATKEIIAGTIDFRLYGIVVFSLFVYAVLSVFLSTLWFGKEKSILRI